MEHEIERLGAETLALQAIVVRLMRRLGAAGFLPAVADALDDAARQVEDIAIQLGKSARPGHTVEAIRIVETLRTAVLGDHDKPRHGV